ncbi:hypothetical protein DLAC_01226 [Tieghemostelium lacteum]|uniref:Purple acid phosphatase N-terminal domain-containing protein n=1 Tax=Tieghemostelium lacteum TaxID=361077 RepID=A0A152A8H9_TIELA|nr:hypothetical protein DLAC_01226 [Tieghemostelium lacteum]|eukprot:KYR02387.1 hypothetical protein DLAC_01226 [Tieghemostelium lacteum]
MSLSFHTYFYLIAEIVILAIILLACIITFSVMYVKFIKRGLPKRDSALHGLWWAFVALWMGSPLFIWISTAFNGIHWVGAWVLMSVLWITGFLNIIKTGPTYHNSKYKGVINSYFQSLMDGFESIGMLKMGLISLAFIAVAWVLSFFTYNICVGIHPFRVTSEISRRMGGASCPKGQVCNFLLTVPEDLSTSVIVNFHSNDAPDQTNLQYPISFVLYDVQSHSSYFNDSLSLSSGNFQNPYAYLSNSTVFQMSNIKEEDRFVHWADLSSLVPATTYFVVCGYQFEGKLYFSSEKKFRTAPSDGSSFTFVSGGDMSHAEAGYQLSKAAGESEPLFVMVGGDVAYDSGQACCYRLWDQWFEKYDEIFVTPSGFTVPLLTAIGNHESTGWKTSRSDVQFYSYYLPYQLGLQGTLPVNRPFFHSHHIGNDTMIMILDSEVVETTEDQNAWIQSVFSNSLYQAKRFKIACYHIAIYPCTKVSLDTEITDSARENWPPIFDSNNLTIAFENHYHLYKRTKLMKNGEPNPQGTLYIGDGAWGVNTVLKLIDYDYLEKYGQIQHILRTTITPSQNTILVESINEDKEVFDSWNRTLSN